MSAGNQTPRKHSRIANLKDKANTNGFKQKGQPSPKLKSAGKQKSKFTREMLQGFLSEEIDLENVGTDVLKQIQKYFPGMTRVMWGELMSKRAMMRSVVGNDSTNAFDKYMNQAYGAPKQEIETSGEQHIKITREIIK